MKTGRMPLPGEKYRHFKGKLYQIVTLAEQTETGEVIVVYQALYDEFKVYARPLAMFQETVDTPSGQRCRFEPAGGRSAAGFREEAQREPAATVERAASEPAENVPGEMKRPKSEQEAIMFFLDTDTYEEKWNCLSYIREFLSDRVIDTLAAAMDVVIPEGDLEDRYVQLRSCISTYRRFETRR